MATGYRMIIRCHCLLNKCRISVFPRRVQIKPAENNLATTPQAFCGCRGYMALRGHTFYPWGDGPGNLATAAGDAHAGRQDSVNEKAGRFCHAHVVEAACCHLPCQHGGCPSPKQDDFISSGTRPSVLGHHSYPRLLHS